VQRIVRILRNTDQPIPSYIWRAWLVAYIPSLLLATITAQLVLVVGLGGSQHSQLNPSPLVLVLALLLISPWLETLLMWPILSILKRVIQNTVFVALASGTIWGILHSTWSLMWGFIVWWPFFVFSVCFLEWEKKSIGRAITVTALVHTCQNVGPAIMLTMKRLAGN